MKTNFKENNFLVGISILVIFIISFTLFIGLKSDISANDEKIDKQDNQTKVLEDNNKKNERSEDLSKGDLSEDGSSSNKQSRDEETKNSNTRSFPTGNFKGDFSIEAPKKQIESGDIAGFNVFLKITGSNTVFENAKIEITLPNSSFVDFKQDLNELKIDDVIPELKENVLTWNFKTIKSGVMDKVVLKLNTSNGLTPNNSVIAIDGKFSADNLVNKDNEITTVIENEKITVNANGKLATTNFFKNVDGTNFVTPSQGDTGIWSFSFSVPKLDSGSKFIKEGSKIKVEYEIDAFLEYKGVVDETPEPTKVVSNITGTTSIIWEFDAPTTEQQKQQLQNIYEQNFRIKIFFPETIPMFQVVQNKLNGNLVFFDEETTSSANLNSSIAVLLSNPSEIASEGTPWAISGRSPNDAIGGTIGSNPDIKVYDSALLGFTVTPTMGYGDHPEYGPVKYHLTYSVDDHLDLDRFYSGAFSYRPNSKFPSGLTLKTAIVYDVYVKYGTKDNQDEEYSLLFKDVTEKKWYQNINSDEGKHISEIQLRFHTNDKNNWNQDAIPAGMFGSNVGFYFSIEKGYVGPVVNNIKNVELKTPWGADEYLRPDYGSEDAPWPENFKKFWGPFSAQVMPMPTGETKVARTNVKFANTTGNLIDIGKNKMNVSIASDAASIANLNGPFESYVLLPIGSTLALDQNTESNYTITKVTDSYKNSKQQLVKIVWKNEKILPNNSLKADVNVDVSTKVASDFTVKVFSFISDQDFVVPEIQGTENITDTYKIKDIDDLNGNGNTNEYIITSGNNYVSNNKSILEVSQSISSNDNVQSDFIEVKPDSEISYKLSLKNTTDNTISKMVLIDVLPSISDIGITTHEERGSKYDLALKGPIILPTSWQDKVSVKYSTSKNPKTVGIIDKNTIYPASAQKLENNPNAEDAIWLNESQITNWSDIYSFMIEVNNDVELFRGESANITAKLKTPGVNGLDPALLDGSIKKEERAAYNSFAIATNASQAVETNKVGVALNDGAITNPKEPSKPDEKENNKLDKSKNKQDKSKNKSQLPKTGMKFSLSLYSFIVAVILSTILYIRKRKA